MTSRGDHIRLEKGAVVKHHYEVVTSVGSGNFSKVYRVLDLQLSSKEQKRRPLAMKVIKKEYSSDAKYEKQMLITLHKNDKNHTARVSKMHECFLYQDCPVFIMPIHGPSIRNRRLGINRGVVTHDKLLEFAYDILETMDFVHFQCNMVHTDLKPENILIADCNVAENSMGDAWVVCDFGSASLWRLDKLDSDLISTRPYRAPEVVLGNKWHYAADMWSVGCILYEVAVGHRLFEIRDDLTHLHMMDRRLGRLPEAFTKSSRYASKFFNTRGEFLSTPDVIRFGKCRLTPLKEMFRDDRNFLHLLEGLFVYDPSRRMTATEALALPMFNEVRAARRRRTEREAEEAEARRERRRAASAAAASATTTAPATTNATGDSLMSTFNSLNDTVNTRLTDRTDRNTLESTGESKKLHHSTKFAVAAADMDGGAAESPPAAAGRPKPSGADAVSDSRGTPSPHTGRSTTETATTATSRISVNVSPQKEGGKSRATTGSASPHSTITASSSGGGHGKTVKPRGRAVSTPAAITKEVPSHRPVVDNHRASTGATTLATTTTTVVPKLALGRILSGGDSRSPSTTTTTAAATTSKVARSAGEGGISKAARHANGQPGRASGLRTASPAERHASGSTAPADVALNSTGASKPAGSRTPRKNAHGSRRSSAMSVGETAVRNITAGSAKEGDAADVPAVTPHTPDSAGASASDVPRMVRGAAARATPFPAAQAQSTNYSTASSTAAATSAPAPSSAAAGITSTPVRAPSTTPLGYLSPLERGMTAAGITTRTEPPVDINSPEQHGEEGEGAKAGKSRRGSSNVGTEDEATTNAASEGEASSLPSPVANHTDGSPRATDYRSPVRRRPAPVVTPTDDTSAPTSPEVSRRSPRASMSPMLTMEKVLSHPFPQTQPAPNLAVPAAQSEGHRTPREVSPAPVTGRGGSPVTTARRVSQPAALQAPATGGAAAVTEADAYVLASTVPIVRAPPSRGTSRSGSLASTLVTTPSVDAPVRTLGSGATFTSSTGAAPALPAAAAEAQASASSQAGHSTRLRSPLQSSLTPRSCANAGAAAAATRTSGTSAGGVLQPVSAVPSNASSPLLGSASTSAAGAPSMKPVINVSAATGDRLKSVPPASIADVRGPSAIPVSASRRTVVKPSPAPPTTPIIATTVAAADTSTPTTATSNSVSASGRSGIPEHPVARPVTPTPSAPRASEGASHLPEAVTRSRERSLAVGEAEREKEKERATSRRGSANSSLSALHPTIEAATPKTPLPSATGAAGTASLSSSLSLPSTASHPTVGVVRQRSGSTQLVAGHTSGLESNPALSMTSTAAGHGLLYTPRGSRVLTEHSLTASGRSSAAPLPAVVTGAPASSPPLTSSQGSGRTLMTLATPGAAAQDGDPHSSRPAEHTVESRPTTPRGSGRTSVKSLDLHKLHPSSSTGTSGTRPPRSSLGGRTASRSPAAPAGGRSPRSSGRPGPGSSHSGQAALNASTSSLHLGVTRSPRRPVAPGAGSNSNAASLMASMDGSHTAAVVRSPRSPRSSSRGANSPRGSASSKAPAKTVSPRRAQLSPRLAPSAAAAEHASEVPLVSVSIPTQPLPPSTPAQGGPARLSQPRRSITVISSKPASSAQLSRYSSAAAVAPTRTSAQRPPPTDVTASTGKLPSSGGLSASYNAPAGAAGGSVATIMAPTSRQNSFPESANTSTTEGDVAASSPPAAAASSAAKYRRDARTLKRIVVSRPSPQSSGASMVSPQELVDEDGSSLSPAASIS